MFGCLVAKSCPILLEVRGLQSTRLVPLCVRLSTKILKWVAISFSRESSPPREGIRVSPALAGGFFTTEPRGKPKVWCTGWFCVRAKKS